MSDEPRTMSKQDVACDWALEPPTGDQQLKFALVVGEQRIEGQEVPFKNFVVGDMTERLKTTEDFLSRLLGTTVRIETGE